MLDIPARDELRLAVAMNGGVSLAVWIGGVATELQRFRSDEVLAPPWRSARQQLGIERVVIDVLAGSSAGGLNAVFLALAQAFDDVALHELRDVWFELADFDSELLRDTKGPTRTPLDGEYFLGQLESKIAAMVDERTPSHHAVDLRVTATSLRGEREDFPDLIGSNFVNSRHEVSFRFRTDPTGRPGDFADPSPDGTLVRNLATAGRASASFPVAFEPVLVSPDDFGPEAAGIVQGFDRPRFLADGGILDNLPVGRAVEAIFRQPADEPVNRVMLAIIPLHQERRPGDQQAQADDRAHPYSTFAVGLASAISIPRNETSAAGLYELDRLNRDSAMLVRSRTVLFDLPLAELYATGQGLWFVYVSQQMMLAREGDPGVVDQPPWLPADPWERTSRRSGAAVRRAAAIVLDVLTRVADSTSDARRPEWFAVLRRRVYDCIDEAAGLDPYDPQDPQLAPTRSQLFEVREARDGQVLDVGADLGGVFERLASIVAEAAPVAAKIDGLRSLDPLESADDAWRWLTALEVSQGALGPTVNPQSTVHSAIVSPARAALIDPQERVSPSVKLAGDDLGHFGAFLKRAWRANDWMWGRLDAASALGAICARLGLSEPVTASVVADAQRSIVREEAPAIVKAIVHDLAKGAKSPRCCELINNGKPTRPSKKVLDELADPTWDQLVDALALTGPDPESEFLRRLNIGQETVKDELRGPLLVRVGTRFAAAMTKTAVNAEFPSLLQRFLNIILLPLRGITAAAARFTSGSRQPILGLIAVVLFAAGAADILGVLDLGSFAVLVWPAAAALALVRLAEAPVTTLLFAVLICGLGLAYVLVDSDRWSPGSPYESFLQNRAFVIGVMALLWVVMGLREVQRIDDVVERLRS